MRRRARQRRKCSETIEDRSSSSGQRTAGALPLLSAHFPCEVVLARKTMKACKQVIQNKQRNLFFSVELVLQRVDPAPEKKTQWSDNRRFFDILHNEGSAHRTEPELNHTCHAFSSPFSSYRSPRRKKTICQLSTHPILPREKGGAPWVCVLRHRAHHWAAIESAKPLLQRSAAGLAILQTPSNKFSLNKYQLKKVSQHQVATTPSLRRQQQHLTSDWFHHRPRHGLDLVWRSMPVAGLLGLRTFLSHA